MAIATPRRLIVAALALCAIACAPPTAKPEPPAPAAPPPAAWVPADGPGIAALAWVGGPHSFALSCTMACDPAATPKPDEPQPLCTNGQATFMAAAAAPAGSAAKPGDKATLFVGDVGFDGVLSADAQTEPGKVELRLPITKATVDALNQAQSARLMIGAASIDSGPETGDQFKQFAASCAGLGAIN